MRWLLFGVDALWFLLSALNVNVKKFNEARVNSGSNYDSLKVAKCLVNQLLTRMNGSVRFLLSLAAIRWSNWQGYGLACVSGERRPCWVWLQFDDVQWHERCSIGGRWIGWPFCRRWNTTTLTVALLMGWSGIGMLPLACQGIMPRYGTPCGCLLRWRVALSQSKSAGDSSLVATL